MQKLITTYLEANHTLGGNKVRHGDVAEHFSEYLAQGWRIVSIHAIGSAGGSATTSGWIAALLEKQ